MRDGHVTGVQTCALPICPDPRQAVACHSGDCEERAAFDDLARGHEVRDVVPAEAADEESRAQDVDDQALPHEELQDRKSTRLNSSHVAISYAVFCLKKKIASEQR